MQGNHYQYNTHFNEKKKYIIKKIKRSSQVIVALLVYTYLLNI